MTTRTDDEPEAAIDTSGTAAVPFTRLVGVELRKMVNTRSGFWLLSITFALLLVTAALVLLVTALTDQTIGANGISQAMVIPLSLLVPVLAILTVTAEWSQRTHLVTFALEPNRSRVLGAKLTTVLLLGLATIVTAVVVGAVTNLIYGAITGNEVEWNLQWQNFAGLSLVQVLWFLMAFGLGMLLLSTPAAVAVFYFFGMLAPFMVYQPLFVLFDWARDVLPWVDLTIASIPLSEGTDLMGQPVDVGGLEWAQFGVATLIWVIAPLVLGALRVRSSEVK